ncbi:MAG: UbiA family prenyltransferase, partial [Halobacteriota archaeon]
FNTALRPLIRLTRPPYLLLEGFTSLLFLITFQGSLRDLPLTVTAILAVLLIGAGSAAVNDYFDRESDMLTHLERPIPSGEITPAHTAQFAAVTFIGGLGVSLMINPFAFAIAALNVVLFILYPRVFKRLSGFASNLLMGYLGATVALFAGAVVFNAINVASLSFVGMIAAAVIAFNVLKDILTLPGDVKVGYPTLAARHGIRIAATIGSVFILLTIAAAPIPYLTGTVNAAYLFPIALAACIVLITALSLLKKPDINNVRRQLVTFLMCWIAVPIALIVNVLL